MHDRWSSVVLALLLASSAHAVVNPPHPARASHFRAASARRRQQPNVMTSDGWVTGVDQGGRAYYFRDSTGEFQYDPPPAVQQNFGSQVFWRLAGLSGTHYWCNYALCNGDVQVLSRFNMLNQKVTVSRVQCIVQVTDGGATLTSAGRGPTLWRRRDLLQWVALNKGDQVPLTHGDLVSLDVNDPEGAIFECQDEGGYGQGSYEQGGYQQGGYAQEQQLPAGWTMGYDETSNAAYYINEQTGVSQWDYPQQGSY